VDAYTLGVATKGVAEDGRCQAVSFLMKGGGEELSSIHSREGEVPTGEQRQ